MTKRIQNLIATKAQWEAKNPVLRKGEQGIEGVFSLDNKLISSAIKVGDGITPWNSLPYTTEDFYPLADSSTISLGGIPSDYNLEGKSSFDILKDLLTPYQKPTFATFTLNSQTSFKYEIGTPLAGTYNLAWTFNNGDNVANASTGVINSSDINAFSNLGNVNLKALSFGLTSVNGYTSNIPYSFNVTVTGKDIKGANVTSPSRKIEWLSRIRYGVNGTGSMTTSTNVNNLTNSFLGNKEDIQRVYNFAVGYPYILIPDYIDTTGIKFIDDENQLAFSMALQSTWDSNLPDTISYNNGNTSFTYKIYRGEFYYNTPTRIKIEF